VTEIRKISRFAAAICLGVSLFAFSARTAFAATYLVRPDTSVGTTAIELWFRAPSTGYEAVRPGIARVALASVAASSPSHDFSLAQSINRIGGHLSLNVYPDMATIGVSVPAPRAREALRLMTHAYFTPLVTDDGFKLGLRDTAVAGQVERFEADRRLHDELFGQLFAAGPAHYAPVPMDASAFTKFGAQEVRAFAQRAFRADNAFVSVVGNVESATIPQSAGTPDAPVDSSPAGPSQSRTMKSDVSGIGIAWTGPGIDDAKAATAMDFVADYLFNTETGTVSAPVANSAESFANGQFVTLHRPGVLLATFSGKDATKLRDRALDAVNALRKPLDARTFDRARMAFRYHALSQVQSPLAMADNLGWYATQGDAVSAPGQVSGTYLRNVDALDPGYVAGIVSRYLHDPVVVELIASEGKKP
jgi:predicted Zn-dependent peptidase